MVEAQVDDLGSPFREGADIVYHYYLCSLLIEISISHPLHVYDYEYYYPWM